MSSISLSGRSRRFAELIANARTDGNASAVLIQKLELALVQWAERSANEKNDITKQLIARRLRNAKRFVAAGEFGAASFELGLLESETQSEADSFGID